MHVHVRPVWCLCFALGALAAVINADVLPDEPRWAPEDGDDAGGEGLSDEHGASLAAVRPLTAVVVAALVQCTLP
jgi:hypothetical protein